jgi:hypothetical protein
MQGMQQGWTGVLDQLTEFLAKDCASEHHNHLRVVHLIGNLLADHEMVIRHLRCEVDIRQTSITT